MTDEQFAKLPKWAQQEVAKMQADLRSAKERAECNLGDWREGYPAYGDYDEHRGKSLPCRQVWFREAGITVSVSGDCVEVYGDGGLTIVPHVTNRVSLFSDRKDTRP